MCFKNDALHVIEKIEALQDELAQERKERQNGKKAGKQDTDTSSRYWYGYETGSDTLRA